MVPHSPREIAATHTMAILDRYLLRLYIKVLIVCFVSLAGLYIVIDGFNNLDDFLINGKRNAWGPLGVVIAYFGPRLLLLFNYTSGLLALISAAFALTALHRSNELTAIFAAGISPARVVLPLLAASMGVAALGAANREMGLPRVREALARSANDWGGEKEKKCTPRYDIRTEILIGGKATFAKEKQIFEPLFRLPPELAAWGRQISAHSAYYQLASGEHPAGYLMRGVRQPDGLAKLKSQSINEKTVLFSPADTAWLKPDECFVASAVTFEQLTSGGMWRQFLSSQELISGIRNQMIEPGADVRMTIHSRVVQPLLDLSLVLMGIPLVLSRATRNIFVAGIIGGGLVGTVMIVAMACQALGTSYLLKSTTLAAWLPLLIFGPIAYVSVRWLWD